MAKQSNWMAWGLSAVLAALLVVGVGVTLTHGISVGGTRVHLGHSDHWVFGAVERWEYDFSLRGTVVTRTTSLGLLALAVTWFDHSRDNTPPNR